MTEPMLQMDLPDIGRVRGLRCLRCERLYPMGHYKAGCPACSKVAPSNLTVDYAIDTLSGVTKERISAGPKTMWRYAHSLPVTEKSAVSLGEGMTPLVELPSTAQNFDLDHLYAKCEFANPTGSFKDRLASAAVSAGRSLFSARVIASSSSGNAGAAAAAYAARAGLPCVVFTFFGTAGPMLTQMQAYGAMVVGVNEKAHRWTLLEEGVREFGWVPTSPFFGPVVGSNPYGVEGYKSLSYEIIEQLGWVVPDWIILPVCYGDALIGMARGFDELSRLGWIDRVPRLVAAEIYGSLSDAYGRDWDAPRQMSRDYDTIAVSIGATQSTFQALKGLRDTRGKVIRVPDELLLRWHSELARREGLFIEPSSAASLGAVELLRRDGTIQAGETVVCLFTAGGLKDPEPIARRVGPVPLAGADIGSVLEVVRSTYNVDLKDFLKPKDENGDLL
jgi:threonine synthase